MGEIIDGVDKNSWHFYHFKMCVNVSEDSKNSEGHIKKTTDAHRFL